MQRISEKQWNEKIFQEERPVLVEFAASWCGFCRMMEPILDKFVAMQMGRLAGFKVDIQESQGLASKYNVSSLPTIILFKGGEEVKRLTGAMPLSVLERKLSQFLDGGN